MEETNNVNVTENANVQVDNFQQEVSPVSLPAEQPTVEPIYEPQSRSNTAAVVGTTVAGTLLLAYGIKKVAKWAGGKVSNWNDKRKAKKAEKDSTEHVEVIVEDEKEPENKKKK